VQFDHNNIARRANARAVKLGLNDRTYAPLAPEAADTRTRHVIADGGDYVLMPRLIRFRDAPYFFGMDKNRFNRELRPLLTEIRVGKQGIAFDRLEMEAAAEDYKARNGRPTANLERRRLWDKANRQALSSVVGSGTSIKTSSERAFAKALERAISRKP
jgi:hypothetical protein